VPIAASCAAKDAEVHRRYLPRQEERVPQPGQHKFVHVWV
jgi:hypothetical protein